MVFTKFAFFKITDPMRFTYKEWLFLIVYTIVVKRRKRQAYIFCCSCILFNRQVNNYIFFENI